MVYKIVLDYIASDVIWFGWSGKGEMFPFQMAWQYVIGWGLYGVLCCCCRSLYNMDFCRASFKKYLFLEMAVFCFSPAVTAYGLGMVNTKFMCFYLVFAAILIWYLSIDTELVNFQCSESCKKAGKYFILFFGIAFGYVLIRYLLSLWQINGFMQYDMYARRALVASINSPRWQVYIISNGCAFLLGILLWGLEKKNSVVALIAVVISIFLFIVLGEKSVIFAVTISILIYWVCPFLNTKRFLTLWVGLSAVSLIAFYYEYGVVRMLASCIYRRLLFEPFVISSYYYNSCMNNGMQLFCFDSQLLDWPRIIGELYFISKTYANNGLAGDAVAMWGTGGCIIQALLYCVLFELITILGRNIPSRVMFSFSFYLLNIFINGSLKTNLLSHGIVLFLIMCVCWPADTIEIKEAQNGK